MKIKYKTVNFGPDRLEKVNIANGIIGEYLQQGYALTLRQLYYQFVARGHVENNMRSYKNLGELISEARLGGMVDWSAIEDRTRNLQSLATWESPAEIVESCARQFRVDRWANQSWRPEVWVEKDALLGVIEKAANAVRVPFFSCRGYTSQSELWEAGQRFRRHLQNGQKPVVIHLGDHDPSGIDMTRDIEDRLSLFTGRAVKVERIALNMPQVEEYNPPPNPAKITDSRAEGYIANFGEESWELDALSPEVLDELIQDEVDKLVDADKWNDLKEEENTGKARLSVAANNLR